jgi:hypothetical protein
VRFTRHVIGVSRRRGRSWISAMGRSVGGRCGRTRATAARSLPAVARGSREVETAVRGWSSFDCIVGYDQGRTLRLAADSERHTGVSVIGLGALPRRARCLLARDVRHRCAADGFESSRRSTGGPFVMTS